MKSSNVLVAVPLTILALGCGVSQGPPPSSSERPTQGPCSQRPEADALDILVLGDSIAAADRVTVERRWSAQLETVLSRESPGSTVAVVNRAHGGSEVDLLEREAEALQLDQFDIVFVISGVNDIESRSIAAWRSRYAAVVEKLRRGGLTVVIGTPPPE